MEILDEEIIEALDEIEDETFVPSEEQQSVGKADPVEKFLGKGKMVESPLVVPRYYRHLLAWTLHSYIKADGWNFAICIYSNVASLRFSSLACSADLVQIDVGHV